MQCSAPSNSRLNHFNSGLQDGHGRSVLIGMAKAKVYGQTPARSQQLFRLAVQHKKRFAAFLAADFEVLPTEMRSNTCSKSLRSGFLRSETCRQMGRGILVPEAIFDFAGLKNPQEKAFAEFFIGGVNAAHFDD